MTEPIRTAKEEQELRQLRVELEQIEGGVADEGKATECPDDRVAGILQKIRALTGDESASAIDWLRVDVPRRLIGKDSERWYPVASGAMSAGSTRIDPEYLPELQTLLDELPDAAEQAAEALRSGGPDPSGADLKRFIGRVGRVMEIADEIQTILGR
jgi:hypothetical protein